MNKYILNGLLFCLTSFAPAFCIAQDNGPAALGKLTQQKIRGSQLVELDNVGHLPHIEAFEKFIEPLLAFLKS